jgi:hypothetical protein
MNGSARDDHRNAQSSGDASDPFDEFDDRESAVSQRLVRALIVAVSILIAVILLGIPIIRIIDAGGDRDRESAIREAREYVADQFTTATLDARSARAARQWTRPSLHELVEQIVGFLQASDPNIISGSEAAHAPVSCSPADPPQAECFQSWLRRPGEPDIIRIEFAVAIYGGAATVVTLRRIRAV